MSKRINIGILSSLSFTQINRALTKEEIFNKSMLGDPRHFIREPHDNEVIHMWVIVKAIREGKGRGIYESIKNETPIVFDIPLRGVYNHVLTEINISGEIVLVIIPGLLKDGRTGQLGLSLEEITNLSKTLVYKYDLVCLLVSCQEMDIGAIIILNNWPYLSFFK